MPYAQPILLAWTDPRAKFVSRELLLRINLWAFKWKFSRNNFSVYCCVFFHWLTSAQNAILRQRVQVEFNFFHIYNTRITSVNVGEFYRIFTFRFSFWALFDTQLMTFISKYGFQDLRSKFSTNRSIFCWLWNFASGKLR